MNFADKNSLWVMSLYGFFWYLQKYSADQTIVQRYLVAKSDRDALKGVALGALMCLPIWTLFMLIGTLVWCYYQLSGTAFPPELMDKAGKVISDKVFPHFLVTKIPVGLSGLFMAAVFAAGMSTLASDLNCLSAVGVEDYYRKLRPERLRTAPVVHGQVDCGRYAAWRRWASPALIAVEERAGAVALLSPCPPSFPAASPACSSSPF